MACFGDLKFTKTKKHKTDISVMIRHIFWSQQKQPKVMVDFLDADQFEFEPIKIQFFGIYFKIHFSHPRNILHE